MDKQKFKENLKLNTLPEPLDKLIDFQNDVSGYEEYAQGFGLMIDEKWGLKSWSEDPAFLDDLYPFGQANGSGSFYAIWKNDGSKALDQLPVIVFGDEGGTHVVAENLLQFLQLLSYDVEASVDIDQVFYYKDDDHDESTDHADYVQWLQANFKLGPVDDAQPILDAAQEKYQTEFNDWFATYYNY